MPTDLESIQRQLDRLEGQVGTLAVAIRETDERFRVIIIGDLTQGSRERSILGKLDNDHRRISVLEARQAAKVEFRRFLSREVIIIGLVASIVSGLVVALVLKLLNLA